MSDRISLVRWRHANTDPPKWETLYVTDRGVLMYDAETDAWKDEDGRRWPVSVWCDPSPPGDDALTVDDLRGWHRELGYRIAETDYDGDGNPKVVALRDRLHRAIEDADRE